jgi:Mg-chelatase subunit ChlD
MSNDFPIDPREALEASLTALLLGELPADQAAFLRQTIARDPELAQQYERLKQTVELVRITTKTPVSEMSATAPALKLSEHRRDTLLQRFKTVTPKEFGERSRNKSLWLMPASIAAVFIAICGMLWLPALSKSKTRHAFSTQVAQDDVVQRLDRSKQLDTLRGDPRRDGRARVLNAPEAGAAAAPPPITAGAASESQIFLPFSANADGRDQLGENYLRPEQAPGPVRFSETPTLSYESSANHGTLPIEPSSPPSMTSSGGGLGGAGSNPSQAFPTQEITSGPIAAFQSNYQLETGKPVTTSAEGAALAKNEIAGGVDAVTGLPVQILSPPSAAPASTATSSVEEEHAALKRTDSINEASSKGIETAAVARLQDSKDIPGNGSGALSGYYGDGGNTSTVAAVPESLGIGGRAFTLNTFAERSKENKGKSKEQAGPAAPRSNSVAMQGIGDLPRIAISGEAMQRVERLSDETKRELGRTEEQLERNLNKKAAEKGTGTVPGSQAKADSLRQGLAELDKETKTAKDQDGRKLQETRLAQLEVKTFGGYNNDAAFPKQPSVAPVPQPEIIARENAFSTFSLNVSDVSFKLAAAGLEKGAMPDPASIRVEEFINAFDYRDPEPGPGVPIGFTWERSQYPFAQNRDLLRFSLKTAALGRQAGRPLNLVLLLDNSGSMERADRVRIIQEALRVLARQLQPQDTFSVVTFARTARLWVDGIPGNQAGKVAEELGALTPQGGTNLEEAMNLAYQTALRHYLPNGVNRVVLLTDGAANLGSVDPDTLKEKVETNRKQGIALDCFGIGWEGLNDDLLEVLTRNGDGRYGFINTPEETTGFANQLAGALHVAAADVKVQVEFNPNRVAAYRQIGYAKHQLTKEQFRDNSVDAAEIGAAESGNALYAIEINPNGEGPIAIVRVRYKVPGTTEFHEKEWPVPYTGKASSLQQASPALRLAATASAFGESLSQSPYAAEVTPDALLGYLHGIPEIYGADARPKTLEWMIRQTKSVFGK